MPLSDRPAPERGALVAPNRFGHPLDLNNWRRRVWGEAAGSAGVEATIYDLRHTFASLLIHEGRSLPFVAAAMGHSSGVTTLKHYAHMFDGARLATAVKMAEAIVDARQRVPNPYPTAVIRRLRQAAPGD